MTIHRSDPFATPDDNKSAGRRLRGRLASAVTLWTSIDGDGRPVGLTVSSTVVADGEPTRLLGLIDDESQLWPAVQRSGRFAVAVLRDGDIQLADKFAGLLPAPGGLFADRDWVPTEFGPVPPTAIAWAGCQLDGSRPFGWQLLVEGTVARVTIAPSGSVDGEVGPLVHYRGRYGVTRLGRGDDG